MALVHSILTGAAMMALAIAWTVALAALAEPDGLRHTADAADVTRDLAWCVVSALLSAAAFAVTADDRLVILARIAIALWPFAFMLRTLSIEPQRRWRWLWEICAALVTLWTGFPVAMLVAVPALVGVRSRLTFGLALLEAGVLAAIGLMLG